MKPKKHHFELWLLRERIGRGNFYTLGNHSEGSRMGSCYYFCLKKFEQITGIKLKPGEVRRVKAIEIVLENK